MSGNSTSIDTRLVRRLAAILSETGLTEVEVEHGGLRIKVCRQVTVAAAAPLALPPEAVAAPGAPARDTAHAPSQGDSTESLPAGELVKSPMVGTAYLQPEPHSPPFVRVGDKVSAGQTLLIVEAMKTMNAISAPKAGVISAILVVDGQPVEFGAPLAVIE
jgi:acetyl-CoA carboxylase biotin carboxyl carrier protein